MDVYLSQEQELLQESVRDFLGAECPMELVRTFMAETRPEVGPLWKKMAELGWLGLILDEEHGGAGLDLLSLTLVCQEMGRVLMPDPYLSTLAIGGFSIDRFGTVPQKERYLRGIADGSVKAALAQLEESLSWEADGIALEGRPSDNGFRLDGTKRFVADAHSADLLLVPVRTAGTGSTGITVLLVDSRDSGVSVSPIAYTDQTRKVCDVEFRDVHVPETAVLGEVDDGWSVIESTLDFAKVALCAEMLGGAERILETSVEYAKNRVQFGRPIGSFQAIQHKCSNQFIKVESMRSAVYYAAWSVANNEPDAHVSACLAKSFCGAAFADVAGEGIQIHGGLGFTWEQDLHLYYKRAKASEMQFGDGDTNREDAARIMFD
jgi:alkylation response protein AidB-like acyl-CoA dehydrogenase